MKSRKAALKRICFVLTRVWGLALLLILPAGVHADWLTAGGVSPVEIFDGTEEEHQADDQLDRRGKVTIRRINPQCPSDWNNDPTALPYFFYQLDRRTQGEFPTYVDNRGLRLIGDEMFDYPIIYFTSHYPFTFTDEEIENLQRFLGQGGSLWLDDCTGSGPFMDSVPPNIQRIAPGSETHLMTPQDERFQPLFTLVYRGQENQMQYPQFKDGERFAKPLQATMVNGRPAIIFCPNDYGCQWEVASPPTAMNPLGNPAHSPPSPGMQSYREQVYKLSINWLFYSLTH